MQITHEQIEPIWGTLEFSSFQPPREAVAALFALAEPTDPGSVHVGATWTKPGCTGTVTWILLALTSGGLAIVTAAAEDQWDWRREEHKKPERRSVDARWVPLRQVHGVTLEVAGVESTKPHGGASNYGLRFRESWTLRLADGELVRLIDDQSEGASNRLRLFVERIRSAL
jgi:hypothetical protein